MESIDLTYLDTLLRILQRRGVTEYNCQAFSVCLESPFNETVLEVSDRDEEDTTETVARKARRS